MEKTLVNEQILKKYTRAYQLEEQHYLQRQNEHLSLKQLTRSIVNFFEYQFLPHYAAAPPFWRLILRKFNRNRTLPDFAIVGPIKSGSSDLVAHLLLHPCIIPPLAKEIFSPEPETWRPYYPTVKERRKIERKHGKALSGFLAPFMHWVHLIDRFQETCPKAKIVILLRDPVERAYSHWKWDVLIGGRLIQHVSYYKDFALFVKTALELFPEVQMDSISGFPFLGSGIYYKSIQCWFNSFGRERVMVLDMAEYFRERAVVLNKIQDFLDLPGFNIADTGEPINRNPLKKKPMDEKTRKDLENFYRPYNDKLYSLIEKQFGW